MSDFTNNIEWQIGDWVRKHPQGSPLTAAPAAEAKQLHAELLREHRDTYTKWALELAERKLCKILESERKKGH